MTPLEELQAAHKRLIELRDTSTPGYWYIASLGVATLHVSEAERGRYITDPNDYVKLVDRDLIVTLHRTIDAQLALLADGNTWENWRLGHVDYTGPSEHVMALARAINGEAS